MQALHEKVDTLIANLAKPPTELFSIKQVAAMAGVQTKHIRRAIKQGKLPCHNMSNGEKRATIRISRNDFDTWVASCRVNHGPSKSERDALADHYFGPKPKRDRRRKAA